MPENNPAKEYALKGSNLVVQFINIAAVTEMDPPKINAVDLHEVIPEEGFGCAMNEAVKITFSKTMRDTASSLITADIEALLYFSGGLISDGQNFDNVTFSFTFVNSTTLLITVTNLNGFYTTNPVYVGSGETAGFGFLTHLINLPIWREIVYMVHLQEARL